MNDFITQIIVDSANTISLMQGGVVDNQSWFTLRETAILAIIRMHHFISTSSNMIYFPRMTST
jgi:hypothetical protein